MDLNPSYGMTKEVSLSFEAAVERITETMKEQGFGVLTTIDVKATLKTKIDKDIHKYVILGACNPNLAYQALSMENGIGLFLPCNVVVFENPENGKTYVSAVDPDAMVSFTGQPGLKDIATQAKEKLQAALDAL